VKVARVSWRYIALGLSLFVLVVTGVLGIYNGLSETPTPDQTALQLSVTVGVLLYGAFGLISAYGLFRRQPSARWTVIAWAVTITYVPGGCYNGIRSRRRGAWLRTCC
jgi:uncharacterized membrane protein (DUF2068 family)